MKKRNTSWTIVAKSPLLRPGLEISIVVSEKYVAEEIEIVRQINTIINAENQDVEKTS